MKRKIHRTDKNEKNRGGGSDKAIDENRQNGIFFVMRNISIKIISLHHIAADCRGHNAVENLTYKRIFQQTEVTDIELSVSQKTPPSKRDGAQNRKINRQIKNNFASGKLFQIIQNREEIAAEPAKKRAT